MSTCFRTHCIRWACLATVAALFTPAAGAILIEQDFVLNEQTFTQWLYNGSTAPPSIKSEIDSAVENVDLACSLSEAQKLKLRLAANGDFARFDERVDDLRTELVGKSFDQNELGNIYQRVQKLSAEYQAGLLGQSSLFAKVLKRTLDAQQRQKYEQGESQRKQARYAARVRLTVALLERSCPLTSKQRLALVDLWLAETRPPKWFSEYDWYVVLFQASRIPQEKYAAILDDAQLRVLDQWFQQGQGMEGYLQEQGILPNS